MESSAILASDGQVIVTFTTFIMFLIGCCYAAESPKMSKGLYYLAIGLFVEILSFVASLKASEVFAAGEQADFYIFLELSLLLVSMGFLALSGSCLLAGNLPILPVILTVMIIGMIAVFYSIYIEPDGSVVDNMRYIFPLTGFFYVSMSLWSQVRIKKSSGYWAAASIVSLACAYWVVKLLGIAFVANAPWFFPALFYAFLGCSLLLIRGDNLKSDLGKEKEEIEKCNRKIEEIIHLSPFPIILSRLSDDKVILANNNAVKLFGIDPNELERYHLRDFFADVENRKMLNERLEKEKKVQEFEILVKTPNSDTPFWLLASANIIDYNYNVVLYSAFQDITSRKNREVLLKSQATRDPLTALFHRRYFEAASCKQILNLQRNNLPYSMLMIDADHFKSVNDTFGHKIGDKVLIELASTAERALRDNDIVARYGGEEFVAFLPNTDSESAYKVADRLRETISEITVHTDDDKIVKFTVSIGISSNVISDNVDMLIKTADEAMYRAKQEGRNRVKIFTNDDLNTLTDEPHKEEGTNHHPIFDKEKNDEISLLDNITMRLPGVDD